MRVPGLLPCPLPRVFLCRPDTAFEACKQLHRQLLDDADSVAAKSILAFCSYGREQNFNAPVGKYAAFAYTSALNHLLSAREGDRRVAQKIGDAEGDGQPQCKG